MDHRGIWTDKPEQYFDKTLAEAIKNTYPKETILDLGCGWTKKYAKYLNADGYDGNPNTLDGTILDISQPFTLPKTYSLVICLEVIEHIPQQYEQTVLNNITKHTTNHIILSWAQPNQPGRNHVNCKPQHYVTSQMQQRGYTLHNQHTKHLKNQSTLPWFKNNIQAYHKPHAETLRKYSKNP